MAVVWRGRCLDESCQQILLFTEEDSFVNCYACGQTRPTSQLNDRGPFDATALDPYHCSVRTPSSKLNIPQRAADLVKVTGFSHYHHKLISPLLTTYGIDKHTGKAKLLRQITGRSFLDCSILGERTFRIETRHLDITGFGRDGAASEYLAETLNVLLPYNNNVHSLIPLHVDGDGHCLVHAISRAVAGRELFWHPLRIGLKAHFNVNLEKYKSLLGNFINSSEWPAIIDECEPDFNPGDGSMIGLRNIHVFGLSNLLRRPIILLDSMSGMNASADYAAVFLPGLNPPMACCNKAGQLHLPICLAWSSAARNHYIPLIPVKECPLPKFPRSFLPKVWGFPQDLIDTYMKFDDQNCVTIGGDVALPQPYLATLTTSMDELFAAKNGAPPNIVADLFHYQYSTKLVSSPKIEAVVEAAEKTLQERRLLRCIACQAICVVPIASHCLRPGGPLYVSAKKLTGYLRENFDYSFRSTYGITCLYDSRLDTLIVNSFESSDPCSFCQEINKLRKILPDGSPAYINGDKTNIPVSTTSNRGCPCGFKHWWDGQFHDTRPHNISIVLDWKGMVKKDTVPWFSHEASPELNSNIFDVATVLIQKHFPVEARSAELVQYVANQLLEETKGFVDDDSYVKDGPSGMCKQVPSSVGCSSSLYAIEGPSKKCREEWSPDSYHRDVMKATYLSLVEANRKRSADRDLGGESLSAKASRLSEEDPRSSPKPSTSRLSPKHP